MCAQKSVVGKKLLLGHLGKYEKLGLGIIVFEDQLALVAIENRMKETVEVAC